MSTLDSDELDEIALDDFLIEDIEFGDEDLYDLEFFGSEEAKIEREIDMLEVKYGIIV